MKLTDAWVENIYSLSEKNKNEVGLHFTVPYYQRPYKWEKNHIQKLVSDFFNHTSHITKIEERKYFSGSLVTVYDKKEQRYQIIDGQQRITTLYLMNYLKFMFIRAYIYVLIDTRDLFELGEIYKEIEKCYLNMVGTNENSYFTDISESIKHDFDSLKNNDDRNKVEECLKSYCEKVKLPTTNIDDPNYREVYKEKLQEMFMGETLSLNYKRGSLNEKLSNAMICLYVELTSSTGPKVEINNESSDEIVKHYTNALKWIYDSLYCQLHERQNVDGSFTSIKKIEYLISLIDDMLNNIEFCFILSDNEKDAYTLFEVLNDRALEVNDIDLIKNMFYKKFHDKNRDILDDITLDSHIEELENMWGELIFTQDLGVTQAKLVAYYAIVFLTGKEDLDFKINKRYRDEYEIYLNEKYKSNSYRFSDIKNEFTIFYMIKLIIVDYFNLPIQSSKRMLESLVAENISEGCSIVYKAMHLINALDYKSVMPALINLMIGKYLIIVEHDDGNIIDMSKYEEYIRSVIGDGNQNNQEITKFAHDLWRVTLLSKDYEMAREYAKKVIAKIHYNCCDLKSLDLTAEIYDGAKVQFIEWSDRWRYTSNSYNNFKVKLLLLKIIHTNKTKDGKLRLNFQKYPLQPSKIQLDHLEASKIDSQHKEKYFIPNKGDDRSNYVDALGNMMLMNKKENVNKDNYPLGTSLSYYDENYGGHWMIDEIASLLDEYGTDMIVNDQAFKVPTEEFFNTRKENLKKYMITLLTNNEPESTEITIRNQI